MKKSIYILGIVIFSIFFQVNAYAYTKKDLTELQENAALADCILTLPYILSDREELIFLPMPAILLEEITATALENNTDLRSEMMRLIRDFKLLSQLPRYRGKVDYKMYFLKIILTRMANYMIKASCLGDDLRVKRRIIRVIITSMIDALLLPMPNNKQNERFEGGELLAIEIAAFAGKFCSGLFFNGIAEYIGEKIIKNADDLDNIEEVNKEALYV